MNVSASYRYALYCAFCKTVNVRPMPYLIWLSRY